MLKNIKDSLETAYKQGLESDDSIYIKGQIKDWEEMLSNIKHEQELKDNALKMYDEGQQEIERLNKALKEYDRETYCKLINENRKLNNIINEIAEEILKELEENHHLSYGVALAIRQKLLNYKELKGSDK